MTNFYKADGFCFGSDATQPAFIKPLIQLANESQQICANEGDDAIHYQQFIYYSTLNCFERWNALRALSYGLARLVELAAETQDTPQRRVAIFLPAWKQYWANRSTYPPNKPRSP